MAKLTDSEIDAPIVVETWAVGDIGFTNYGDGSYGIFAIASHDDDDCWMASNGWRIGDTFSRSHFLGATPAEALETARQREQEAADTLWHEYNERLFSPHFVQRTVVLTEQRDNLKAAIAAHESAAALLAGVQAWKEGQDGR